MITVFSIPKPFTRSMKVIQANAVESWRALDGAQVILLGDEPGTADAAAECGVTHVAGLLTSHAGTPRLDDAFKRVDELARFRLRCFVNADVVLLDDFLPALQRVSDAADVFLMIGATLDLAVDQRLALADVGERRALARRARETGRSRGATAIDFFAFTAGLFDPVPPFVVGRARFDNWLVWRARQRGIVVDASDAVAAVHQRHDYAHVRGGFREAHFGEEADRNLALAGGNRHLYTLHDASHRLTTDGRLRRNLGAIGRFRESRRKIAWKLGRR